MPHYLLQVAYTPEAWATLVKSPQDRISAITPVVQELGGTVKDGYLCFGDYDTLVICEFPDDVSAAAFSMAIAARGACKAVKTTPLIKTEDGIEALRKAATSSYSPPS